VLSRPEWIAVAAPDEVQPHRLEECHDIARFEVAPEDFLTIEPGRDLKRHRLRADPREAVVRRPLIQSRHAAGCDVEPVSVRNAVSQVIDELELRSVIEVIMTAERITKSQKRSP
jgi:hypothetical protein